MGLQNAGYVQGCLLKRRAVPNPLRKNRNWHWSDLNNGAELSFFGVTYRLCNCDPFTKRFLSSQGVVVNPDEPVPDDPYMVVRRRQLEQLLQSKTAAAAAKLGTKAAQDDKLKRFLEYDGKVLRYGVDSV